VSGNGEAIASAVERLIAEAERLGGPVPYADVLRLAERHGVSTDQIPELTKQLADEDVEVEGGPGVVCESASTAEPTPSDGDLEKLERKLSRRRGRLPNLTPEQEQDLTRRVRAGENADQRLRAGEVDRDGTLAALRKDGLQARRTMVERNQGLVRSVAETFKGSQSKLSFEDMVGEGQIGLLKAIQRFDHLRGFKFSTYATYWIFQSISRALANTGSLIRVPVHMHTHLAKYRRTRRSLEKAEGREPTLQELSQILGWPLPRVFLLAQIDRPPTSLDAPIREHEGIPLRESLPSQSTSTDQLVAARELHERIEEILGELPKRERSIIHRRFGLREKDSETLEEIGTDLGVTRERIRQIESKGLTKLRHPRRSRRLWEISGEDGPCPDLKAESKAPPSPPDGSSTNEPGAGDRDVRPVDEPAPRRKRKRRRT
jgi:RNA polymerase primary sigma factor